MPDSSSLTVIFLQFTPYVFFNFGPFSFLRLLLAVLPCILTVFPPIKAVFSFHLAHSFYSGCLFPPNYEYIANIVGFLQYGLSSKSDRLFPLSLTILQFGPFASSNLNSLFYCFLKSFALSKREH